MADDNADMRDYVARLLAGCYEVEAVAEWRAGLASVLDHPPDLVLSDVMMPGLDGFGLLRALRENPETSALPVILLSARAGEEARVEGLDSGATDYLVKPFTARELLARVGAHMEMARIRKQAAAREAALRAEAEAARDEMVAVLESIKDGFAALRLGMALHLRQPGGRTDDWANPAKNCWAGTIGRRILALSERLWSASTGARCGSGAGRI